MTSESESDIEFYDASDITPIQHQRPENSNVVGKHVSLGFSKASENCDSSGNLSNKPSSQKCIPIFDSDKLEVDDTSSACSGSLLGNLADDDDDETISVGRNVNRVRRHKEGKKNGNKTEEILEPSSCTFSPDGSQSSSVDAVYPNLPSHPFRVVEQDATSIYSSISVGKGVKMMSNISEAVTNINSDITNIYNDTLLNDNQTNDELTCLKMAPEPDLVASTKSSSSSDKSNSLPRDAIELVCSSLQSSKLPDPSTDLVSNLEDQNIVEKPFLILTSCSSQPVPVPPPRKRSKRKEIKDDDCCSISSLPVPTFTSSVSDTISIGQSLDLKSAVRGEYLVKPQDLEQSKATCLRADETLEAVCDSCSQASTPEVSRSGIGLPVFRSSSIPSCLSSESSISDDKFKENADSTVHVIRGIHVRSGLTDEEILEQVTVLNLDTGEKIPLSEAEKHLQPQLNPLSLHIMKITSRYASTSDIDHGQESDDDGSIHEGISKTQDVDASAVKKKTAQFKRFLGKKVGTAVNKAKSIAHEVSHRNKEEKDIFEDDTPAQNTMQYVKIKTSHSHKGPNEFDNLMYVQEISGEHTSPIWCMKFSGCGRLLATAGQDHHLRVWVIKQAFNYFLDIRAKCNADVKASPTPSQESLVSQQSGHSGEELSLLDPKDNGCAPFMPKPFCVYSGHTADVLDISWSKNYFLLTSSMDKTVRLWHISRKECLCIFQHMDFVTAIVFHPKDDRYFVSGSLDGKLRFWSIPDKRVVLWNEVGGQPNLITAANFCQNGKFTVVGTYDGRCIFYETDQLKYFTQIHVRSTKRKNARGRKITGIEPLPGEDKILVTSNDSRIRLYDLRDLNLSCKYKGHTNISNQIRASFSNDGKFIVIGSENQCIYIWKTYHDYSKFTSARRDRNVYWEGVKAHNAVVTCAIFAPHPELVFNFIEQQEFLNVAAASEVQDLSSLHSKDNNSSGNKGYMLISADFEGCLKVFLKKEKPKHSSLPVSALI